MHYSFSHLGVGYSTLTHRYTDVHIFILIFTNTSVNTYDRNDENESNRGPSAFGESGSTHTITLLLIVPVEVIQRTGRRVKKIIFVFIRNVVAENPKIT